MPSFSDPFRPTWAPGRRTVVRDGDLRVSDAERQEVADALSRHYGEGRLDQAELDERLNQAMAAKTRGDLAGLLADFPRPDGRSTPAPEPPRRGHHLVAVAFLVAVVLVVTSTASAFFRPHVPWILVALVVFLLVRRGHRHDHLDRDRIEAS